MALAFVLVLLVPLSPAFLAVYALCGLTDVLDGFVARRTGSVSVNGGVFDSIADALVAVILIYCLVPHLAWEGWMITWIAAIASVRLVALGIGSGRFGRPAFVHTYMNKTAGLLLFASPFLLAVSDITPVVVLVCSVTTVAAFEYFYINCTSEGFDPDRISVLVR